MKTAPTSIAGVFSVTLEPLSDERGKFLRHFCKDDLAPVIEDRSIVQINQSLTRKIGAIRGLHYQYPPYAEMKLVRCLRGRIFDTAIDLRSNSPTFLCWHAEELSQDNYRMLVIPEGCAHGFQVMEADSELLYLHTAAYAPSAEGVIHHGDPRIGIRWPLPITEMSLRDKAAMCIPDDFCGVRL
jgi:dTDP-4-dehydrorhamnose 3,5-epimerase